jgi:tetratricopeptide (TPR) repeat protein
MGLEDYDQALQNLLRSATLAEEIKALPLRQRALETIAMISKERMAWGSFNDILAKLIASHPNDLDLIHMQASALFEQKEYEKALPSFQHLTQITPGDSSLWNELGSTLEGLKRMKEAIDVFSHAIVISPETAYLRRNRANALIELNRLSEAEEDIAKAVELEPDHPYTHARQGDLALAQGKFSKALPHFEFAAANDDNKSWKIGVALSKFGMDDLEVARTELSTALSEANDEEREEARDWLERIVKIKPELEKDAQSLREMLSKT